MGQVIAIVNQKGGIGKTTSAVNIGIGMAALGKKVLLIDMDPQGSLTASLGYQNPDELAITVANVFYNIMNDQDFEPERGIIHHTEGIDLMPANIELSEMEVKLVNTVCRETILKLFVDELREAYDYIIIDCPPSLGMLTINVLAATDSVIIPVQAQYLSVIGLQQLLRTIGKVRKQINPKISIDGIVFTMVQERASFSRELIELLHNAYGEDLNIYPTHIPASIRAVEASSAGVSIYLHDPKGKVAAAYRQLTKEVLGV